LINLKSIPVSKKEIERLKQYEQLTAEMNKENNKRNRFPVLNSISETNKGAADRSNTMDDSK